MKRRRGSSSTSSRAKRPRNDADVVLLFAGTNREMSSGQIKWAVEKLKEKFQDEVDVVTEFSEKVTHVVVTQYTSQDNLDDAADEAGLENISTLVFYEDIRRLINEGVRGKAGQWLAEHAKYGKTRWADARAKISGENEQNRQGDSTKGEALAESREQLLSRLPMKRRDAAEEFLRIGDANGIPQPDNIRGLSRVGRSSGRLPEAKHTFAAKAGNDGGLMQIDLNTHITFWLNAGFEYYKANKGRDSVNEWRAKMMKEQRDKIASLPVKITKVQDLIPYKAQLGLSQSTCDKVGEVLNNGFVAKYKAFIESKDFQAKQELVKLHGVGSSKADELIRKGFMSIKSLRTPEGQQAIGRYSAAALAVFEDLQERIPREEVEQIRDYVKAVAEDLWPGRLSIEAVGSFRRGKHTCGDVDLIFSPLRESKCPHIEFLACALERRGFVISFLQDVKALPQNLLRQQCEKVPQTCFSICRLPDSPDGTKRLARRLDLKFYSQEAYPFALVYFTGNEHYNRSLRWYCRKHGFSLSDTGLYVASGKTARNATSEGRFKSNVNILKALTERDVFAGLGFPYKEPTERNSLDESIRSVTLGNEWKGKQSIVDSLQTEPPDDKAAAIDSKSDSGASIYSVD